MSPPTTAEKNTVELEESVWTTFFALAMQKVQRRRHRPKKNGRLHRV